MTQSFTIELPDDVAQQLQSQAAQLNVSPDVLVAQWVIKELAPVASAGKTRGLLEPLTGKALVTRVKQLENLSQEEKAKASGYYTVTKSGVERVDMMQFYKALIEAEGIELVEQPEETLPNAQSSQRVPDAIASRYPQGAAPNTTTIDDLTVTRDLADLLIRLRQAHSTGATTAAIPATAVALNFLQILQTLGFIDQIQSGSNLEAVHVTLTSTGDRSVLEAIERLSLLQAETDLEHSPDLMDWITHLRNPDPAIREKAVSLLGVSYGESNP